MRAIATRVVTPPDIPASHETPTPTSQYFGMNTLGAKQMRDKLPKEIYAKLVASIRLGKKLDLDIAPAVAHVIKEWALSRGVTHFCHWFQPQTGLTAEKHDSFLNFDENKVAIEQFTGDQLIQSEPDASSFPSGGLRATWEARGYTAWNPASPVFIFESPGAKTALRIPSAFIGYHGEALDELYSPCSARATSSRRKPYRAARPDRRQGRAARVHDARTSSRNISLIDRTLFAMRPDLVMGGRTLIGALAAARPAARWKTTTSAEFPERVPSLPASAEVEFELYKLGVPITMRHNEVAPCQFEMAPVFEETDIAVDHNQLVMSILRSGRAAPRLRRRCWPRSRSPASTTRASDSQLVARDHVGQRT